MPGTVAGVRTGDIIPEIAADPNSENVYLVWQARAASGKATIMFSRSTDGGRSWSTPTAINARRDVDAFTPAISVAPNGVVTVTYYDLRAATAAAPLLTETRSIHSHDGGATWGDDALVNGPFDQSTAAIARGYFLGDYEALGAEGAGGFQSGRVEADGTATTRNSDVFGNDTH